MNRTAVAVLGVAALLGGTSGTALALTRQHDAPSAATSAGHRAGTAPHPSSSPRTSTGSSTSPSPTPSPTPTPGASQGTETNEPLLYAAAGVIHDGSRATAFAEPGRITRLVRVDDGWLAATSTSDTGSTVSLWHVHTGSAPTRLAAVTGWDADATGTHVTAYDTTTHEVRVWGLRDDLPQGSFGTTGGTSRSPFFVGGDVWIGNPAARTDPIAVWNVQTGETGEVSPGYPVDGVSAGGSYVASDGGQTSGECLQVHSTPLKKNTVTWRSCAWTTGTSPARFSPDGTKLLTVPSDAAPLEPRQFVVLDVTDGPSKPYARVPVPQGSMGAEWADNTHLYVYGGATGATSPTWIQTCDLSGSCQETVTTKAALVVGSGV